MGPGGGTSTPVGGRRCWSWGKGTAAALGSGRVAAGLLGGAGWGRARRWKLDRQGAQLLVKPPGSGAVDLRTGLYILVFSFCPWSFCAHVIQERCAQLGLHIACRILAQGGNLQWAQTGPLKHRLYVPLAVASVLSGTCSQSRLAARTSADGRSGAMLLVPR